jgi:hypothetical protein
LVLLPPALLIAVSLYVQPVFDPRFLTVCAAPLFLVVGAAASAPRSRALRASALAALVTVGTALSVWQANNPQNPKMYQLRESIAAANALSRPGDVLLMVPHLNTAIGGQNSTDPVTAYYRPRQSLRLLSASSAGALTRPEAVWKSVRRTRPRRAFIVFGFESARSLAAGASLSARYRDFFGKHATGVRTHRFTNVVLRVYTFDWGGVR